MNENFVSSRTMLVILIVGLFCCLVDSLANVVVLNPTDDTYVDAFTPIDSYGASEELCVGPQDFADQDRRCRTFIKFDLSSVLPVDSIIISAILEMDAFSYSSTAPPTVAAAHYVYPSGWGESLLNWNSPPNALGGFIATASVNQTISSAGIYHWNVTSSVIAAHYGDGSYHVLLKVVDDEWVADSTDFIKFRSKESGSPPNLIVTYSLPSIEANTPVATGIATVIFYRKYSPHTMKYKPITNYTDNWDEPYHFVDIESGQNFLVSHLEGRPTKIEVMEPNMVVSEISQLTYDLLGRLTHGYSNPNGSNGELPTEIDFGYDVSGNLTEAKLSFNDSAITWSLGYDSNDNIFKRVYEKKNHTIVPPLYTGAVDYFLVNSNEDQLLYKTITGALPEAMLYNYDTASRLTSIMADDGGYLREYLYNPDGLLAEYSNHENDACNSALSYTYDALSRLTGIVSATNDSAPESVLLGQLALSYNDNGTLSGVGYSTDEDTSAPVNPIYSTNYTYDGLDRRIKAEYLSHDPNVPDIMVVMDPDGTESDYMVTQYIYDSLGRLAWTVHSNGYVSRTIYNQGAGLEQKEMLQIHMEDPTETYLTCFEHNAAGEILRTTDLQGHFTQHDHDSDGNLFCSYVLGIHGGGGSNSGAYGQVYQMSTYAEFDGTPYPCLRFEFDQYGDFGVILQTGDVGVNGAGIAAGETKKRVMKKLSRNKKITRKRPAKDNQKGCTEAVIGDLNGDCKANFPDFSIFCDWWLTDKTK